MTSVRPLKIYGPLALLTVFMGLSSRAFPAVFPGWYVAYAGDFYWALMFFLIFAWVLNGSGTLKIAWYTLVFAYTVEFSQLLHPPWLVALRHTKPFGLLLGYGFVWSDLVSYAAGIMAGVIVDHLIQNHTANRGHHPTSNTD